MAFSFGTTPAAPAAGGFGAAAPAAPGTTAPAPSGGGLFGAPAPTTGGFSFGGAPAAPAPSTGLFGSQTPAPAAGGLFGSSTAPAPATGGGLFGSKAPAPSTGGGLFGSSAPAPSTGGGLFGSTSNAPAPSTSLFGAPAPSTFGSTGLFGSSTPAPSAFGAAPAAPAFGSAPQQAQQSPVFSGNTPYSQLPDNAKRAIDQIYQLMMQHRRTLASVKTMAPALLADQSSTCDSMNEKVSPADAAAGSPKRTTPQTDETLSQQMVGLNSQIQTLLQSAESNMTEAHQLKSRAGEATAQAKLHGAWPVENVAARRGVALSSIREALNDPSGQPSAGSNSNGKPASSVNVSGMTNLDAIALQQIMDIRASHVDRVEAMPSPYYYEVLHNFEQRVIAVQRDVDAVRSRLAIAEEAERVQAAISGGRMMGNDASLLLSGGNANTMMMLYQNNGHQVPLPQKLASLARSHSDAFIQISAQAARAHEGLAEVKLRYQRLCQQRQGYYDDPFLKADVEEISREREMQHRIREEQIATAPPPEPKPAQAAPSTGLFGAKSPAPATGGGLFGAPAPSGGGLFGSTPTSGGLFGSTTPAPAGGGLFGSTTPAPAAGGLFGSTAPAAPAAGGGLFGSTTPAAPAAGGGLFGSTTPAAPAAGGGLFGSTTPAAPAAGFGAPTITPTTPASTLAPRKKPLSRNRRK
mmetsp:Transcript_34713/g.79204  ORF Transcript_34713/g.79204 Transcript_34713/m.79204 type:complete len:691 (-) Transcript_34713:1741-3813(-)